MNRCFESENMAEVRRIAVFRALHLGDLLLAVPALRSIRSGFPDAEITLIGLPWAESFAARFDRYVDRFVAFAGYPGIDEVELDAGRIHNFLDEQRNYRYDLAIQMHGSGATSNPLVVELGAGIVAGYAERAPAPGVTIQAPYPQDEPEVCRNLGLARLLGCPDQGSELEFPLFDTDRAHASRLLRDLPAGGPLVALHAGSRAPSRRWPAERFAAVADHFVERHHARVVLTGGPDEEITAREVEHHMRNAALNLAGQTSLGALAAIIQRLDLFVSNDTGPAHLAEAVGTPGLRIFGPAEPRRWAPLDSGRYPIVRHPVPCSPCRYSDCPIDHRCMRGIEAITVIQAAENLLSRESQPCAV